MALLNFFVNLSKFQLLCYSEKVAEENISAAGRTLENEDPEV